MKIANNMFVTTSLAIALSLGIASTQTPPKDCPARIPGTPLPGVNGAAPAILRLAPTKTIQIEIFGHSENRGYHTWLQSMLNQAPILTGVKFTVTNNWIGGHEAFEWAKKGSKGYNRIDTRLKAKTAPMIALCLFSNNSTYPIKVANPTDANFVRLTTNLSDIADHLYNSGKGVDMVYFSSHRYKPRNFSPAFNERAATTWTIQEAGKKKKKAFIKAGPEQHDLHWCCYPTCYAKDLAHTNTLGDQLMARAWYLLLVRELTGGYLEPYGTGSPGTGGVVPVLGLGSGHPSVGNQTFTLESSRLLGGAPLVYLLGAKISMLPILVAPQIVVLGKAGGTGAGQGTHTQPLPIPSRASLVGAHVFVQTAALDAQGWNGLSLTQGLDIAISN